MLLFSPAFGEKQENLMERATDLTPTGIGITNGCVSLKFIEYYLDFNHYLFILHQKVFT